MKICKLKNKNRSPKKSVIYENKLFTPNFSLFIEQGLSQDWPVSAEVDLDDMEYHEGIADSVAISSAINNFIETFLLKYANSTHYY